uniref:Protein kinase domain-containing protein n=1 Tax=Apis cerana TaxID=7461 RepID=V9IK94_APICE
MSAKASSSMTSYSPEDMLTEEEDEVAECILDFPREKLNIVENLGCGYFGDVHICEVDRFPGYDEVFRNTASDLVIVKSLRPGSSDALRIEFQEEAKKTGTAGRSECRAAARREPRGRPDVHRIGERRVRGFESISAEAYS